MLGRVAAVVAPGVVLLAAGAFAAHEVGIGAAKAGGFDRLMDVEHDVMFRGFIDDVLVVVDHVLAVVPLPLVVPGVVDRA